MNTPGDMSRPGERTGGGAGGATPLWMWLVASVALVSLVSAAGGAITATSLDDWYVGLAKPALTPPNSVFPVVWSTLFVMMAIAAFIVLRAAGSFAAARIALIAYAVQLALNLAWSALFFGLRAPLLAGLEVIVLLLSIGVTIWLFWRHSRWAAGLLVPYFVWVAFATWLNWSIVALNP